VLRRLVLLGAASAGLACAGSVSAHEGGGHIGFVAKVSTIDPPQLGLLVHVLGGHERLSVRNLTKKTVVIFGANGRPTLRLAPGRSGSMPDPRIGSTGPPPVRGEFVKSWRILGETDGQPFEILGFLGYRAPPVEEQGGRLPAWAIALAIAGGGIVLTTALALPLRRREGESERSE
jgi:hypothetical protein